MTNNVFIGPTGPVACCGLTAAPPEVPAAASTASTIAL